MDKSTPNAEMQMQLALAECSEHDDPIWPAIAAQFPPVNRQTLKRRFHGERVDQIDVIEQVSKAQANSEHHQCLSIEQEEVLISHINMLTNRGLPPTSTIVKNLAEEISRPVGKN
jgi:hypothetical protein